MNGAFIGDELTAVGFRLAGLEVVNTDPERAQSSLEQCISQRAAFVVLTAEFAARVEPALLESVQTRCRPPVAVIPDICEHAQPPSVQAEMKARLGIGE